MGPRTEKNIDALSTARCWVGLHKWKNIDRLATVRCWGGAAGRGGAEGVQTVVGVSPRMAHDNLLDA